MVAPANNPSFDILLRFVLDEAANKRVQSGISTIDQELQKLKGGFPGEELSKETAKFNTELKKTENQVKQTSATLRAEARVMLAQANAMVDGAKQAQISVLRDIAGQIQGISRAALAGGLALTAGIFAAANKYVNDAEQATEVTRKWKSAQDSLNQSGMRFGAVLAETALPLLEKAARLADRASRFAEQNPDVVRAALNSGLVVATLGAVGIAVSRGIKLYADVQALTMISTQLTAAKLQDQAANKQLLAAQLRAKELGVPVGGGAIPAAGRGLAGALTSPTAIVTLILATLAASAKAGSELQKLEERITAIAVKARQGVQFLAPGFALIETALSALNPLIPAVKNLRVALERDMPAIARLLGLGASATRGGATAGAVGVASLSSTPKEAVEAWIQFKEDDAEMIRKHYEDRRKIVADALATEQKANADYSSAVSKVRADTTKQLSEAARNFSENEAKAEQQNQQERAKIIRDGGQELARIEQNLQERLRRLKLDHEERTQDLVAAGDALGLAKEQRRFAREQAEVTREAGREIADRRADIAQRIADLQQSYQQERAERLVDYQQRVAEIQANARERLAELQSQHQAELKEIRDQKVARIRELDAALVEERKRRYQMLVQTLRDIDTALLGETRMRQKYYAFMQEDLDRFLASYRAGLATIGASVPARAEGGYAAGLVRTGERGYEYVLSHSTTRAAENLIGGRLTQDTLLSLLMRGGGRSQVVWNDQRRFDGDVTNATRRMVRQDTMNLLRQALS